MTRDPPVSAALRPGFRGRDGAAQPATCTPPGRQCRPVCTLLPSPRAPHARSRRPPLHSRPFAGYSGRPFGAMRNSAELRYIEKALDPLVASVRPQMRVGLPRAAPTLPRAARLGLPVGFVAALRACARRAGHLALP